MNIVEQLEQDLAAATQGNVSVSTPEAMPKTRIVGYDAERRMMCQTFGWTEEEADANAHLICLLKNNAAALIECAKALHVMALTPGICAHLEATDPMALKQAEAALAKLEKAK